MPGAALGLAADEALCSTQSGLHAMHPHCGVTVCSIWVHNMLQRTAAPAVLHTYTAQKQAATAALC
jgi:hypothetical protein